MADNSRHVVGATTDQVFKATPTGIAPASGSFSFGGYFYLPNTNSQSILRLGSNDTAFTRGHDLYLTGSNRLAVRNADGTTSDTGGSTGIATGWRRIVFSFQDRFNFVLGCDGVTIDSNVGSPNAPAFSAGDGFGTSPGIAASSRAKFDGRYAWMFYLSGVFTTIATLDARLQDPQSFVTNYGAGGSVSASALKALWPGQCSGSSEVDKSGVGNDGAFSFASGSGPSLGVGDGPSPSTPWSGVCGLSFSDDDAGWFPPARQSELTVSVW